MQDVHPVGAPTSVAQIRFALGEGLRRAKIESTCRKHDRMTTGDTSNE